MNGPKRCRDNSRRGCHGQQAEYTSTAGTAHIGKNMAVHVEAVPNLAVLGFADLTRTPRTPTHLRVRG
jgi:hypothetical protein